MPSPQSVAMGIANAIPGCEAQRFALEANTVISGRVMGWGPSLHLTGMTWAGTPQDMDGDAIAESLSVHISKQRQRIAAAAALGLDTTTQQPTDAVGHIVADRALLESTPTLPRDMRTAIGKMVQSSMSGRDSEYSWLSIRLADGPPGDPRPRVQVDHTYDGLVYDGTSLLIQQRFPETLVMSIAGRTVGEVVWAAPDDAARGASIARAIADRTITSAAHHGGGLTLYFEGDWVPVA